jgi:hypothetical protein
MKKIKVTITASSKLLNDKALAGDSLEPWAQKMFKIVKAIDKTLDSHDMGYNDCEIGSAVAHKILTEFKAQKYKVVKDDDGWTIFAPRSQDCGITIEKEGPGYMMGFIDEEG